MLAQSRPEHSPDVLLICPTSHRASISHHIHSDTSSSSYPSLSVDIQTYDQDDEEFALGTCSVLRQFASRIQNDFVLLPCDFIPPADLTLNSILNKFRTESKFEGAIVTSCWFRAHRPEKGSTPEEWGSISAASPVIWDKKSGSLLHIDTADDVDRNGEDFELRMALVTQCVSKSRIPTVLWSFTPVVDSHAQHYRLHIKTRMCTLASDLCWTYFSLNPTLYPSVANLYPGYARYSTKEQNKPSMVEVCVCDYKNIVQMIIDSNNKVFQTLSNETTKDLALRHSTLSSSFMNAKAFELEEANEDSPSTRAASLSMPSSPVGQTEDGAVPMTFRVGVVVHHANFAARANNLPILLELNRHVRGFRTFLFQHSKFFFSSFFPLVPVTSNLGAPDRSQGPSADRP
jgi:translation initiation factor eIF-2B subunit gamma